MTGLDLLLICSGAIVLMTVGDAILRIVLGPDPDLQGPPWHPDPDHLYRAAPVEPRRDAGGVTWPRAVAEPSESELRGMDGNR